MGMQSNTSNDEYTIESENSEDDQPPPETHCNITNKSKNEPFTINSHNAQRQKMDRLTVVR